MKNIKNLCGLTIATALLVGLPAMAAEPAYEWITDPAELAARGFDADAPPIKRLIPAEDNRSFEERLAERQAMEDAIKSSSEVGGRAVRWAAVQGNDFKFLNEGALYNVSNFWLHGLAGTPNRFADAPITLRDDKRISFLDVWTNDTSAAQGVDVALYRTCHPAFTAGTPDVTELAVVEAGAFSGGTRFQFVSVPGMVYVDNPLCTYFVRARFSDFDAGSSVQLQKVRVVWAG
ncbi:MAG: hypothetical protein KF823_08290 [Xanthomonadales bacterium]|nr:hypothetical protein [Xanthomonadales bacterium]